MVVYTVGHWTVKPGHEDAFVSGWTAMSEWTLTLYPTAVGRLLHDRADESQFISYGAWRDEQVVQQWRGQAEFGEYVARLSEHLDDFRPGTFDLASGPPD
jgi:heme-degrading monooxygenase HmoA